MRRLKTISGDIKNRISAISEILVCEKIVDPYVLSKDNTLIEAKGYI